MATTLRALAGRHRVVLLTKGDGDDQMGKVARSGLRRHLHQVDVVPEKDDGAYRDVLRRHGADPARTWMIGNSPKSDILPALRPAWAPCSCRTRPRGPWNWPQLPAPHTPRYIVLDRFRDLLDLFYASAGGPTVPDDFVHGCGKIAPEAGRLTLPRL